MTSNLVADLLRRQNEKPVKTSAPPPEIAQLPPKLLACVNHEKLKRQVAYFRPPEWVSKPPAGNHLEVTKEGVKMRPLSLDQQPYYILGKQGEIVDHIIEHPSTGRAHCVICYRSEDSQFFLVDNNSTNGTYIVDCNDDSKREKLKPMKYHRLAYDSKFAIGLSTRIYCLKKKGLSKKLVAATVGSTILPDRQVDPRLLPLDKNDDNDQGRGVNGDGNIDNNTTDDIGGGESKPIVLERCFSHILIKHKDVENPVSKNPKNKNEAVSRSEDEAKESAKMIREALVGGESFEDMAKEFSECKTAKVGGFMGTHPQGTFSEAFEDAAFKLLPGEISRPVVTALGIHLIMRNVEEEKKEGESNDATKSAVNGEE